MERKNLFLRNKEKDNYNQITDLYLPNEVYYICADNDDTVLIGMDVKIMRDSHGALVRWLDTVKERRMYAAATEMCGDVFSFTRIEEEGGGVYCFTPISLEIYQECVKNKLSTGENFNDLDVLKAAFLNTINSMY